MGLCHNIIRLTEMPSLTWEKAGSTGSGGSWIKKDPVALPAHSFMSESVPDSDGDDTKNARGE